MRGWGKQAFPDLYNQPLHNARVDVGVEQRLTEAFPTAVDRARKSGRRIGESLASAGILNGHSAENFFTKLLSTGSLR